VFQQRLFELWLWAVRTCYYDQLSNFVVRRFLSPTQTSSFVSRPVPIEWADVLLLLEQALTPIVPLELIRLILEYVSLEPPRKPNRKHKEKARLQWIHNGKTEGLPEARALILTHCMQQVQTSKNIGTLLRRETVWSTSLPPVLSRSPEAQSPRGPTISTKQWYPCKVVTT
jgi:hypothetical protein